MLDERKWKMNKAYYIFEDSQKGPFTLDELTQQSITPETMVWAEPMKDWGQAKNVPELQFLFQQSKTAEVVTPSLPQKNQASKNKKYIWIIIVVILLAIIAYLLYDLQQNDDNDNNVPVVDSSAQQMPDTSSAWNTDSLPSVDGNTAESDSVLQMKIEDSLRNEYKQIRADWNQYIFVKVQNQDLAQESLSSEGVDSVAVYLTNNTDQILNRVTLSLKYIDADNEDKKAFLVINRVAPQSSKKAIFAGLSNALSVDAPVIESIVSYPLLFHYEKKYVDRDGVFTAGVSGNSDDPWLSK